MRLPYDVLSEEEAASVKNIIELYDRVLGRAMEAKDLCGVITCGPLEQSVAQHESWGGASLSFGSCSEVWHVRSAPYGRIGLPLGPKEVRKVTVMIRKSATDRFARVTNIKLWRWPHTQKLVDASAVMINANELRHRDRCMFTQGAVGLGTHGLNIFESRAPVNTSFAACDGCHTLLSAVASIGNPKDGSICKTEASMTPHYVVAACLAGMEMNPKETPDTRECAEQYTEASWDEACELLATGFQGLLLKSNHMRPLLAEDTGLKLMFCAEDIFESISFVGLLDLRGDPFYKGSLPTDMSQPSGLPLLLAIAVLVACHPERWGLPPPKGDDAYAVKEATVFIESIIPSVLSLGREGAAGGEQQFTIDLVTQLAQKDVAELIHGLKSGQYVRKHHNLDHVRMARALKQTMMFLQCGGVAVCTELFGVQASHTPGCSGGYTRFGYASQLVDPVVESRMQSAHENGLGNIVERWPTLRTTSRGRRQLALADVFVEVDSWLRTGKHNGTVLAPTMQPPASVQLHELKPGNGALTNSLGSVEEMGELAATVAAAVRSPRSAKKKGKQRVDAMLAERSKQRDANQQQCAQEAIQSLFKPAARNDKRIEECCRKINGAAITGASTVLEYILQLGACGGSSVLFNFSSYMVAYTSSVRCAHCDNDVNVVQSIGFAGSTGICPGCGAPRCLECVDREMRQAGRATPDCRHCHSAA